ncbi:unnamed protein product [Penicillium nalgiovense]|uniref:Mid2 domain-containing protein n=1 Tax=Penicillium nalgiovense TaxID=60175 RepID=A0A9W4I3Q3_PENNA|nr:unnamed protein product [Penicillium nalgiovense]CAG8008878.1 unnamed protein product [Penicillium nalgiovense]CAG8134494.1 unnamed protein product [Penicillium nalgiovense]CAG8189168.1 unnamed protein product [Penicillium nalgiovense]CAG8190712.1 unnamed protein product [Penicillium nalgiovense]
MMASSLLSLLLYFTCLPSVSAWIFSWHEPDGKLLTVQDDVGQGCKLMNNPVGNVFDWTPQEGYWCLFLYGNTHCEEPSEGYTCKTYPWPDHVSSADLLSFKVKNNTSAFESSTSSTSGSSSAPAADSSTSASLSSTDTSSSPTPIVVTTPTADATHAASSSSATSASSRTDDKPTISGGAVAGIVVGVLAAVAIAGLVFFLIRRRRQNAAQSSVVAGRNATVAMAELPSPHEEKSHSLNKPIYRAQGFRELHGSDVASEIGSGIERHELDATQILADKKY